MWSTADDFLKFARMLLGGEVLDGSTVTVDVDESGEGLRLTPVTA